MVETFSVPVKNGFDDLFEEYCALYRQLAKPRFLPDRDDTRCVVYDIEPAYGTGTVQLYRLRSNALLTLYDLTFDKGVVRAYDLSADYFEIEYCVDGCMRIEEEAAGVSCFGPGCLSLSLSQGMKGTVSHCPGERYQGVSFAASKQVLPAYFGSSGLDVWDDMIENLGRQARAAYYLGRAVPPDIGRCFLRIYGSRLPARSRTLFYESKVIEALALIMSDEVVKQEDIGLVSLTPYELRKIKEVPQMLLDRPFELPSIQDLSKQLVISPKKLTRGFRLVFGDTPYCYHRKLTLRRAASMLLETERTVSEIAYMSGYSNPSNFCTAFKRCYGMTPLKYREASLLHRAG